MAPHRPCPSTSTSRKRWARGTAILFAVGAVSGTVLSFELGLLWPAFMTAAGPVIGMPFSLEGFAFSWKRSFSGLYLYGWEKLTPAVHVFAGIVVSLSGALSGVFVVTANAWMNTPAGFRIVDGQIVEIDPFAAMFNPAAGAQVVHMLLAAYAAVGVGVAGIHARLLLRDGGNAFHRRALSSRSSSGCRRRCCNRSRRLGGTKCRADAAGEARRARGAVRDRGVCAAADWRHSGCHAASHAVRAGDSRWTQRSRSRGSRGTGDRSERHSTRLWPPVAAVHMAFQVMVGIGTWLALLAVWAGVAAWRGRLFDSRPLLKAFVWSTALGFVAIEAGWTVTELGRQPWIIQGVMRTSEAVTPMPGLVVPFASFTLIYIGLAAVVITLLRRTVLETAPAEGSDERPCRAAGDRPGAVVDRMRRAWRRRLRRRGVGPAGQRQHGGAAAGDDRARDRPVWEANHVWLIIAVVMVFTGFPGAFAAVSTYLHVPLVLVLIGIVLRGSAFVFRAYGPDDPRHERFWGRVFAVASSATPLFLGVIVGAVTDGRLPAAPRVRSWPSM